MILLRASILSGLAKGAGLALSMVVLALGVRHLGKEGFGQLVTLQAINATSLMFDIGLGQGLINRAARSSFGGAADLRAIASTAFYSSLLLAVLALVVAASCAGIPSGRATEFRWGIFATVACMAANLPLSIAIKLGTGFQEYAPIYVFQIAGTLVAAVAFFWTMQKRPGLLAAVLSVLLPPLLALFANNLWCFLLAHPELRPQTGLVSLRAMRDLLAAGIQPFIAQGCSSVIFVAPIWSIHAHAGAVAAGTYSAMARLLSIPTAVATLTTTPLWPIVAKLLAEGRRGSAERLVRNAVCAVAGLGVIAFAALSAASPYLLGRLTHSVYPLSALTFLIAGLCLMISLRQTIVMAVLGAGASRHSTVAFLAGCLISLALPAAGGLRLHAETIVMAFLAVEATVLASASLDLWNAWRLPRMETVSLAPCSSKA
ncbi:MAG: oligosaccharide flippase family protein [Bryobacteraceae bacterium]